MASASGVMTNYRSVVDLVIETLRREILDHTLQPNERLRQEELAARLGVSRIPVRDALRRLEAEGLVTISPRGAVVADISPSVIREDYIIRAALEGRAARLASENLDAETLDYLAAALDRMKVAELAGDFAGVLREAHRFHARLYAASGLPRLCSMIETLRGNCERYRRIYMSVPGRMQRAIELHAELLAACQARDADAIAASVEGAILESADVIVQYVARNGSCTVNAG